MARLRVALSTGLRLGRHTTSHGPGKTRCGWLRLSITGRLNC